MHLVQMLTEDEMMEVLTRPKNALAKQYRQLFLASDTDFKITKPALRQVTPRQEKQKTMAGKIILSTAFHTAGV
jgi:ATP-dependent Clp protease ATP-binding subunit ClpX